MKKIYSILCLLASYSSNSQTIKTIAGTGVAGYSGDGGPAVNAQLNRPGSLKFDKVGNLYIADDFNHVVRKINSSGNISTIAGTGVKGHSGDGGPATAAQMDQPEDIVFDTSGNMYISEVGSSIIRKINKSGIISTFAGIPNSGGSDGDGGPATAARIYVALGLSFDKAGNMYFSNNGSWVVRKINTSGIISTVAGNGTNGFSGDGGPATAAQLKLTGFLAIGPSDDEIYIPDYVNCRIRKVNKAGIITTVWGDGSSPGSGDGGPATAAGIGNIYRIFFDDKGSVYLSDRKNPVIRKINSSGMISTIAGTGVVGYFGDGGPATAAEFNNDVGCSAIDQYGNLYITDLWNHRVRRITYNNTGIKEINTTAHEAMLYPNPANNEINLLTDEGTINNISIVNTIGKTVYSYAGYQRTIDISTFPAGLYFLKINDTYAGKFIKQ